MFLKDRQFQTEIPTQLPAKKKMKKQREEEN